MADPEDDDDIDDTLGFIDPANLEATRLIVLPALRRWVIRRPFTDAGLLLSTESIEVVGHGLQINEHGHLVVVEQVVDAVLGLTQRNRYSTKDWIDFTEIFSPVNATVQ